MRVSAQLQGDEDFSLLASEIDQLTEHERLTLERTAKMLGWVATAAPGWGKVIYRRAAAQ